MTKGFFLALAAVGFFFYGCDAKIDKAKFGPAGRAAHALEESLAAGVTYERFGELLNVFARDVELLKHGARPGKEEQLAEAYSALLGMYRDGYLLLKYRKEFKRYDFVPAGLIYVGQDVEPIAAKYRFQVESHVYGPTKTAWKSIPEGSINLVWFNAEAQLKLIDSMLNEP